MQIHIKFHNEDMQLRLLGDNWTALTHPFDRTPQNAALLAWGMSSDGRHEFDQPAEIRGGTLYCPSKSYMERN